MEKMETCHLDDRRLQFGCDHGLARDALVRTDGKLDDQ